MQAQSGGPTAACSCCVPHRNVFLKLRASLWHRQLFDHLNEEALDPDVLVAAATTGIGSGSTPACSTSRRSPTRRSRSRSCSEAWCGGDAGDGEAAWSWSILPYLQGDQPDLEQRIGKLVAFEERVPGVVAPRWAHHRYTLLTPSAEPAASAGASAHSS